MKVDPDKVKELILIFSKLDDEYQNELLSEAYKFKLLQGQKNVIKAKNISFKKDEDYQKELLNRANEVATRMTSIANLFDKAGDTEKAVFFMVANQLAGKANSVEESDISITINKKEISMKDYIEKNLVNADYEKAKKQASKFMKDYEKECKK